ncbi:tetratricopeptide repeat protein [Flavobacterium sp. ZT3R18]|uniref:tetratricopeptide repeat protein n=1 Tax=Flavobacterium sp. ZT3R18 TaxID=2594429 RepID=UPI00117BAF4D|nr:tetratricopeptide repeat protein [Flavobacterium sp. ZT3R18]TRX36195.1 tetratricopeptide repeat protein [Flavobacterium sp. ZT3R18]
MKKKIILFLLIFISISCNSQNKKAESNILHSNFPFNNSLFFSYKSICNIKLEFLSDNDVVLIINGKIINGKMTQDKNDKSYFNIMENKKHIMSFSIEDSKIIVENQKYQFGCESAKFIELIQVDYDGKSLHEIKEYIKENTDIFDIASLNDKAYYLEQMKCYKTSAYILEQILKKHPDRVVAYLNLGDARWGINDKENAEKSYKKYIELMTSQGKDLNKIPKRVYDRTK